MYLKANRFQQAGPVSKRVPASQRGKAPGSTPPNVPRSRAGLTRLPDDVAAMQMVTGRNERLIIMNVMPDGAVSMNVPPSAKKKRQPKRAIAATRLAPSKKSSRRRKRPTCLTPVRS